METDLVTLINEAAVNHQWVLLGVAVVCLVVPIVLKALGKSVPIVDQAIAIVLKVARGFSKPKVLPAPGKEGVEAVVKVEEEKK